MRTLLRPTPSICKYAIETTTHLDKVGESICTVSKQTPSVCRIQAIPTNLQIKPHLDKVGESTAETNLTTPALLEPTCNSVDSKITLKPTLTKSGKMSFTSPVTWYSLSCTAGHRCCICVGQLGGRQDWVGVRHLVLALLWHSRGAGCCIVGWEVLHLCGSGCCVVGPGWGFVAFV